MGKLNLDYPLIQLSGQASPAQNWTIRNAFEGVQIFGGIGSGKTSGSGRMLALKYLSTGFGGLVLTVKPGEKKLWEYYCQLTGRENDLLVIEPGCPHYFNFLEDENHGKGATENIAQVLKTVLRVSAEKSSGSEDPFWETALDMLIFNVIDLCKLAYGRVTVKDMYDMVLSIPKPESPVWDETSAYHQAFNAAKKKVEKQVEQWENTHPDAVLQKKSLSESAYDDILCEAIPDARVLRLVDEFFGEAYYNLSEKTRSIIDFSFSGFLYRFLREPIYTLFCSRGSTFKLENCFAGKIILINLPVKIYQKIGRDCQIMFKYIWQLAAEKRDVEANDCPLFLWADEAQNFIHEHDADYQATARSSYISTVYLSQNLPNYHANMGGAKAKFKVDSFLGTLATKIFHANADVETNRYASELIGDGFFEETSRSVTASGDFSAGRTHSLKIDRLVRPEDFCLLKTGGELNNNEVSAYMHVQGNTFKDGSSYSHVLFNQNYKP